MKSITKIKTNSIIYEEALDILEVFTNAKAHHSINLDDLMIIHLNKKNKIIGLEIFGISRIYGIPRRLLNNLKSAQILISTKEKKIFITTKIVSVTNEKQITTNLITTPPLASTQEISCL